MYIAVPFVIISYLLINLSYFAVLSVREITDATAVALVRYEYCSIRLIISVNYIMFFTLLVTWFNNTSIHFEFCFVKYFDEQ